MFRTLLLGSSAIAIVVLTGLAQGVWTDRWQRSQALELAAAQLEKVPLALGDWKGSDVELNRRDLERTGAVAWVIRRYEHRLTRQSVSILLVCGRSGPIGVHTPDVCYGEGGYTIAAPPALHSVAVAPDAPEAAFWTARFHKTAGVVPEDLRIFWSWRAPGGDWSAPENPRLEFARSPALYKLYVIRLMRTPDEKLDTDPALDFIRQLLPELNFLPQDATPGEPGQRSTPEGVSGTPG